MNKFGDTYEGEWHFDKMQGRGGYVYATASRRNDAVFKGWFGSGDGSYPGELSTPGFSVSGNFGYVTDPLKLNFTGQINSLLHRRRPRQVAEGESTTEGNPGYEVTEGKEWVRFFLDKTFDDEKWALEKSSTAVDDLESLVFPFSSSWDLIRNSFTAQSFNPNHHCLFLFLRDFLVLVMETCKAAGLYFLRSVPSNCSEHSVVGRSDRQTPLPSENSIAARLARPLLAKLVRDARAFQKHLERGVLDYFGLSANTDETTYQSCLSSLNSSMYAPLFELLWPLYRTVVRFHNANN